MTKRKTIDVEFVLDKANYFLATDQSKPEVSSLLMREVRYGVASLLEQILMETNTYKGFRYLESEDADDSRRYYYKDSFLTEKAAYTPNPVTP